MRIDVTSTDGNAVSIVQAHESFRRCVGQSAAEFALDLLESKMCTKFKFMIYCIRRVWLVLN